MKLLWKRILRVVVFVVALVILSGVGVAAVEYGRLSADFIEMSVGFLIGMLVILGGAPLLSKHQLINAFVALACGVVALISVLNGTGLVRISSFFGLGVAVGGLIGVGLVVLSFSSRRDARWGVPFRVGFCAAGLLVVGMVYGCLLDGMAQADVFPRTLVHLLGKQGTSYATLYKYHRGGLMDEEYLWRVDTTPEGASLIIRGLGMRKATTVPVAFWNMPPHYWPRSMPAEGLAFRTPFFTEKQRGADGYHYFIVYDQAQGRVFVWVKDNFGFN